MTNSRRQYLITKLKSKTEFLTKDESDELGPVTATELAPITGDSFIDEVIMKKTITRRMWDSEIDQDGFIVIEETRAKTDLEITLTDLNLAATQQQGAHFWVLRLIHKFLGCQGKAHKKANNIYLFGKDHSEHDGE